jgi:hypothetical protein
MALAQPSSSNATLAQPSSSNQLKDSMTAAGADGDDSQEDTLGTKVGAEHVLLVSACVCVYL